MMFAPVTLRNWRRMSDSVASSQTMSTRDVSSLSRPESKKPSMVVLAADFPSAAAVASAVGGVGRTAFTEVFPFTASAESSAADRSISSVSPAACTAAGAGIAAAGAAFASVWPCTRAVVEVASSARRSSFFMFISFLLCRFFRLQSSWRPFRPSRRGCAP